jgi:hypothetical protein
MRMVKIQKMQYVDFEVIRDALVEFIPFALVNAMYSKKLEEACFLFWDSDYVPQSLAKYIVPMNQDLVKKADVKIRYLERIEKGDSL